MAEVIDLNTIEQWEELRKNSSQDNELLIFKFSPVCPISSVVDGDLKEWISSLPENKQLKLARLNVVQSKDVSLKIANDLNIKHESPQAIWLAGENNVKWSASHYNITKSKLNSILNKQ